ncbi:uncharacterized protein LAJ45_11260 [Morchella importuna]|uniref:uncharacterized protein n=1 Tax=Morchella importuna TaxID=1174673 RepID=UPI001E8D28F9|nr:uncharacterized protein LAJ45_11260 [Morchella importuna]KAH8144759.1 hypothetical protein LAJ45_11260 [Morchella importuna]
MDSDDDFGSDDFGDINDDELIAAATQAEQAAHSHQRPPQQNQRTSSVGDVNGNGGGDNNLFLPDDFDSDVEITGALVAPQSSDYGSQRPPPSTGQLRQATLFGGRVPDEPPGSSARPQNVHNYPLASTQAQEPPTHHKIDREAAKTWVYPSNVSHREYQYSIVHKALFSNILVALPTGLGKTFIAATVMLNWFRWAPESQIAFLAPTKPLVAQQIDACYNIAGIPRSQTAELTGAVNADLRREYWEERRVFFLTPQTMQNDISRGICNPKRIVCLVIDEAHKATGNYAFATVVNQIRKANTSLRVLALTATPGATIDKVQEVIDSLGIARVEIRNLESMDIQPYVFKKHIVTQVFELTEEIVFLRDLYCECLQPLLKKLNDAKAYWVTDPKSLTMYGLNKASRDWMASNAGRTANRGLKGMLMNAFSFLSSLALPLHYLTEHGIRVFYHSLVNIQNEILSGDGAKSKLGFINDEKFQKVMRRAQGMIVDEDFSGHPKLDYMAGAILKHFADAADMDEKRETRIMVFTSYRSSAEEVVRVLKKHEPMIKPHIFVGQQDSKTADGMKQKDQIEIIKKFQQGIYNVIVATSIGEEGLDIGEVDMIVCYDQNKTPIRMLQRMGRTGRKREGHVLVLLSKGKEEENYKRAWDDYRFIQNEIESGNKFVYHHDESPRILPRDIQPVVDKKVIEIPVENTQPETKRTRAKPGKKAKIVKPFFMPEGVKTGFVKASRIGKDDSEEQEEDVPTEELAPLLTVPEAGLLNTSEERELNRRFKTVYGTDEEMEHITIPGTDKFPAFQRNLTKTRYVKHGRATKSMVRLFQKFTTIDEDPTNTYTQKFDPEILKPPPEPIVQKFQPKTKPFKPVVPTGKGLVERSGNVPKPSKAKAKPISKRPEPAVKRKRKASDSSIEEKKSIDLTSSPGGDTIDEDKDEDKDEDVMIESDSSLPRAKRKKFSTGTSEEEDDDKDDDKDTDDDDDGDDEVLPNFTEMIQGFRTEKAKPKVSVRPMTSKAAKAAASKKNRMAMRVTKVTKKKPPVRGEKARKYDSDED